MEFYEVINTKRGFRQFENSGIPGDILERIPDAGLKASSSHHQRRWGAILLLPTRVKATVEYIIRRNKW